MTAADERTCADGASASGAARPTAHDVATRMLAFARARAAAFAPFDLTINEITWQLLLDLFVAQERGTRLSIRAVCELQDLPRPVVFRWLRTLLASDLVAYDERLEGLSAPVRLTPAADAALRGLVEA